MPETDLDPPTLVEEAQGMERLLADLDRRDEIAVDTEADSFYSYREKVCLVQITAGERDYLVDPLAGVDLTGLGRIFADPSKTKVFHDSEYDVLILKRDHGFAFSGLFDTRVAAAALGVEAPGLASVLEARFGVELDKSQQRSNWAKRPLTDQQIRYARLDTHYLLPLAAELRAELVAADRTMIVEGECRRLEQLEPAELVFRPDEWVRIKGARTLEPRARTVLRELFALRERLAEASDVPPFRIANNHVLAEIARVRPRSSKRLAGVHGFSPRMVNRMGKQVLACVARAEEMEPLRDLPVLPRRDGTKGLSEVEAELYERLKQWRKGVADRRGIESSYLLNRHVMARIASERPADAEALEGVEGLLPWQVEMFGEELLELLASFERDVARGNVPRPRPWRR